jgi:hypothetical protein
MLNGVDSFVDLTTSMDGQASYREDMELAAQITGREIRHFAHPIPGMGVVDHDGYDRIIARIRGEITDGRVVTSILGAARAARLPSSGAY